MSIRALSNNRRTIQRQFFPGPSTNFPGFPAQPISPPSGTVVVSDVPLAVQIPDAFARAGEAADANSRLIFGLENLTSATPVPLVEHVSRMAVNFAEDRYFQAQANNYFNEAGVHFLDEPAVSPTEPEPSLQARLDSAYTRIARLETLIESFTGTSRLFPHSTPATGELPTGPDNGVPSPWRDRVTKLAISGGLILLAYGVMSYTAPRVMQGIATLLSSTWTGLLTRFGVTGNTALVATSVAAIAATPAMMSTNQQSTSCDNSTYFEAD